MLLLCQPECSFVSLFLQSARNNMMHVAEGGMRQDREKERAMMATRKENQRGFEGETI
jgi:hypothetical protein